MAKALLPHVVRPLALGLTCTYMTQICIDEQKRRCQMIFQPYFPVHGLEVLHLVRKHSKLILFLFKDVFSHDNVTPGKDGRCS